MDHYEFYRLECCNSAIYVKKYFQSVMEAQSYFEWFIVDEMKNYYCSGCGYCCYDRVVSQKWCERRFSKIEELDDYLDCLSDKGDELEISLKRIFFVKTDDGYDKKSERVSSFDKKFNIK